MKYSPSEHQPEPDNKEKGIRTYSSYISSNKKDNISFALSVLFFLFLLFMFYKEQIFYDYDFWQCQKKNPRRKCQRISFSYIHTYNSII